LSKEQYVALAEVARPHGVRGELRLKVYNPDSDVLLSQRRVRLVTADGEARLVRLKTARPVPGALLVKLEGVNDRDAAEALRGARFEVPRDALEEIEDDDEHYVVDLVGGAVLLGTEEIGRVVDVTTYPTCDALVVKRPGGKPLEVPMQGAYIDRIEDGVIHLLTIDGLV
jgi:16S rRNA processing protein RimM